MHGEVPVYEQIWRTKRVFEGKSLVEAYRAILTTFLLQYSVLQAGECAKISFSSACEERNLDWEGSERTERLSIKSWNLKTQFAAIKIMGEYSCKKRVDIPSKSLLINKISTCLCFFFAPRLLKQVHNSSLKIFLKTKLISRVT